MKRILYLTTIILLMFPAGISAGNRKKTPKPNLRILYWNIQNGMWDGQTDNYARFTDWVKEQKPDICVWCEAATIYLTGTAKGMPREDRYLPGHWDELARRYGHKYTYIGGWRDDYPQVITSKYPIEGMAQIVGEAPDSVVSHGAGWARIRIKGETLNLVTVHPWPHSFRMGVSEAEKEADIAAHGGDRYRRTEIEYVCRHTILAQPGAEKELWLMMGDFNSRSRVDNWVYQYPEESTAFLTQDFMRGQTPYKDVIHERAPQNFYSTTGGKSRIDYVYVTPPVLEKVVRAEVITDDYTRPVRNPQKISNFWHPSDHRPIVVDLKL
ncbi:MAG: endonuclease/exonuclease/phosphatase family protein [Bacteroidales bacterium]|nr:endonuclease/exonuclease/phosphatase family protein [Bacteroidales bacterium]